MRLIDGINQYILVLVDTAKQMSQWRIWLVLLGYFLLNWFVLYAHYSFYSPFFYNIVALWSSVFEPSKAEAFTHYPAHFYILGDFFGWAKLGVGLVLEAAVLGVVAHLFTERFFYSDVSDDAQTGLLTCWINLVVVWLILNLVMFSANMYLPDLFAPLLTGPRRIMAFKFGFMPGVMIGILSLFFYAVSSVIVYQDSAVRGILRSLGIFFQRPFTTFFMAAFVLALPLFLSVLSGQPGEIVRRFRPELVYWLLLFGLVAEMFANFFWMGSAVRFLAESED